ncbi:peptidoglycan editing factor PgeF [Comamonas sp. NLF-1-9]|uniref:peptidoglycan editing factor PgeF n=1 Tax=Comamonas sp. NLF-1-9 TaxID=2853163 RepID=UPI001C47CD2F|nr:peptidoglycan editing factor PgeF [Comamonas sp. NLF-1-9]QXL85817.1 peptidoglycan editing factor PgeF [Comamonas sp. NLF-1-9]
MPSDWMVPDWPAPPGVRALCTTRAGGVSAPPWEHCNLGEHVGDAAAAVAANRRLLQTVLSAQGAPVRPVFLHQVHGSKVLALQPGVPDGAQADACTADLPGLACTVMVADCLPVLLCNRAGTRVAAAHAGWRGLAAGVLEAALQTFRAATGSGQAQTAIESEVIAWLGPCIGPQAFEVGAEVRAAFCAADADAARHFVPAGAAGKFFANLPALARQRLRRAGVDAVYGNDASAPWCTVSNPSRFFSHRRDAVRLGSSGRMAACVWLQP